MNHLVLVERTLRATGRLSWVLVPEIKAISEFREEAAVGA
jgi:hypothetical protein